jgi:hypothetical protein
VFDNSIFDVVIGLVFVFFVFSLAVSGINEFVRMLLNTRSKALWGALQRILDESAEAPQQETIDPRLPQPPDRESVTTTESDSLAKRVYDHPIIARLDPARLNRPSRITHIPPPEFARALVDILTPDDENGNKAWERIGDGIAELPGPLRSQFELLYAEAEGRVVDFRQSVEGWFDSSMSRVSDWYRRRTRFVMALYGVIVAIAFNVSAIGLTVELYRNDVVRDSVVALAEQSTVDNIEECTTRTCVENEVSALVDTGLPIWWRQCPGETADSGSTLCGFDDFWSGVGTVVGWFITGAALSVGAAFWFGVLKKALHARSGSRKATA